MRSAAIKLVFLLVLLGLANGGISSVHADEPRITPYEPCEIMDVAPCIESFYLIDSNGVRTRAIPGGPTSPLTHRFAGQYSTPTTTYQWRAPGINHENGNELMTLHVFHFPYGSPYCWGSGKCVSTVDETVIWLFGSGWSAPAPVVDFVDRANDLLCGTVDKPEKCIRMWGLNTDYRYEITLRPLPSFDFSHANGEAMNGRVRTGLNKSGQATLTFSGEPVDFSYNIVSDLKPSDPQQLRADASYKYIGVYAHTTKSGQSAWLSRCNFGRELSLWYSGQLQSMPEWNFEDSSLSIKVSSTHYRADNSLNAGVFNIEMPIETAKCLWGVDLSKAVSAKISVSYPELGISEVITTTSKVDGRFFEVSAAGFHFSAPTIKMKLFEDKKTLPEAAPSPTSSSPSRVTIICVKNRSTKKITAIKPKCPQGYTFRK